MPPSSGEKGNRRVLRGLVLMGALLQLLAVFIFTKGFLLARYEVHEKSKCSIRPEAPSGSSQILQEEHEQPQGTSMCWSTPRFQKVVVLVIDALRYDFVAFDPA